MRKCFAAWLDCEGWSRQGATQKPFLPGRWSCLEQATSGNIRSDAAFADGCEGTSVLLVLRHPFEPDFTPPGVDASWAEQPTIAVAGLAPNILQDHGRSFHLAQFAGFLVDKRGHPCFHAICATAIRDQFRIEIEAPILV